MACRSHRRDHDTHGRISRRDHGAVRLNDLTASACHHFAIYVLFRRSGGRQWGHFSTRSITVANYHGRSRKHDWGDRCARWIDLAKSPWAIKAAYWVLCVGIHRICGLHSADSRDDSSCRKAMDAHVGTRRWPRRPNRKETKQKRRPTKASFSLIAFVLFLCEVAAHADEWDLSTSFSEPIPRSDKKELIYDYVDA